MLDDLLGVLLDRLVIYSVGHDPSKDEGVTKDDVERSGAWLGLRNCYRGIPQSAKWWRLVKPDRMMDCTCSEERFKLSNVMVGRRKFSKPPIDSNKTSGGISAGR